MNIRWAIIFGGAILGAIASVFFLRSRICKFGIVRKITGDSKGKRRIVGLIEIAILGIFAWLSVVNTGIVMIHMSIYWLIAELIGKIVNKAIRIFRPKGSGENIAHKGGESTAHKGSENTAHEGSENTKFRPYWIGIIVLCFEISYFSVGWYQAHHIWKTEYSITTEKELGMDELKIAMFADSHVGALFDGEGFAEKLKAIRQENPDILLISGDFVDDDTTKEDMTAACQALKEFDCRYGKFIVYGNHDKGYYQHRNFTVDEMVSELEKAGVMLIEDEAVPVDDKFYVIGRKDYSVQERKDINDMVAGLDRSKFMVVLDHQPTDYDAEAMSKVDLVLSGHTHGGQMLEMKLAAYLMNANDMTYGIEKRDNTTFIVTSGIADWSIKFKTGTISEYCIINVAGK